MDYQPAPQGKDPQLWHLARRRASFRSHLITYLLVNAGLWAIWYFTGSPRYGNTIPWPAWASLGWGIGLVSHYVGAFMTNGQDAVEKEYNKLTQNQSK